MQPAAKNVRSVAQPLPVANGPLALKPQPLPALAVAAPLPVYVGPPAPRYLILRQDRGGVAQPTVGQPYAYGWFGVAPRQHTITHTGYYGSHWLWPGRLPQ